ncbi:MAG: hypothetical protein ACRYHQ_36180, partial [Janthinobacterium lividum]
MSNPDSLEPRKSGEPGRVAAQHSAPRDAGDSLLLQTELMGELNIPGGAGRSGELQALAARAAIYATRARGDGTRRVY